MERSDRLRIGLIDVEPIKGYEDRYVISKAGDIFSIKRNIYCHGKIIETHKPYKLKPSKDKSGYLVVNLYDGSGRKSKKLHNLVARNFIENPNGYKCVCHKDNVKENCNVDNLYWGSDMQNNHQARKDGLFGNEAKVEQIDENGKCICVYDSISEAQRKTGIYNISDCVLGKRKKAGGYKWQKLVL